MGRWQRDQLAGARALQRCPSWRHSTGRPKQADRFALVSVVFDSARGERLPVAQEDRVRRRGRNLLQVVGDEHRGQVRFLLAETVERGDQRLARGQIETDRRLVQQEQSRVRDQGAGDADPSSFSLGACRDLAVGKVGTPQQRQQLPRPGAVFARIGPPERPQRRSDTGQDDLFGGQPVERRAS